MIEMPGFWWTVVSFMLVLGPLVFVHELGHYLAGRWFGVKAEAFSIGFGREVFGWTDKRGTRWKVGWLQLGGYVRFAGDMNPASQPDAAWEALAPAERAQCFQAKPLWQRAIIVAAGPFTNFVAAFLILAAFAMAYGERVTPPVAAGVAAGSAAERAGLQKGDRIVSINGRSIEGFDDILNVVQLRPGMAIDIAYERDGQRRSTTAVPATIVEKDRFGNEFRIGRIGVASVESKIEPVALLRVPGVALDRMIGIVDMTATGLWQIVSGRRPASEMVGPIGMAQASGQMATLGWQQLVSLIAFVSINLGFINLLPVPMLDGGHLTFYAVEAIRRKPVSQRAVEFAYRTGLVALLALMVFVTANDLGRLGVWSRLSGLAG